jgi:formylglycine-generating enzyme required for sulfatase activity
VALLVLLIAAVNVAAFAVSWSGKSKEPLDAGAAPVATKTEPTKPARKEPDWFYALHPSERPPLPLPPNLVFGDKPGEYRNVKDGSVLVFVPAGEFLMGCNTDSQAEQRPVHPVELSAYFIGKYELTNALFAAYTKTTGRVTKAEQLGVLDWRHPMKAGVEAVAEHPVVNINWTEARDYCLWAGLRLPTEAEWERAASWEVGARKARVFAWGDAEPGPRTPLLANLADEAFHRVHPDNEEYYRSYDDGFPDLAPVGSFLKGMSPVGALDMTGNVIEWCEDSWDPAAYSKAPKRDPLVKNSSTSKIARGGSWGQEPWRCRASYRDYPEMDYALNYLGFRVACSAR